MVQKLYKKYKFYKLINLSYYLPIINALNQTMNQKILNIYFVNNKNEKQTTFLKTVITNT